jgi:RHS repeat-associated protein
VDAGGYQTTYTYDAVAQLRAITNALGNIFTMDYDPAGQMTVIHDPVGNRVTIQWDARSLMQSWIDPLGKRATYTYTPTGRQESLTDPRGQRWTTVYDSLDRAQATVDPLGFRSTLIYDPVGRVSAVWDARGNLWTTAYDVRDLPRETTDPLGRKATFVYNALGQAVTLSDGKGQLSTYTYSNRYELLGEIHSDGTQMTYSYDVVGQLRTVVDATGWHTLTYNARGDLTTVQAPQHPNAGILTFGYDPVGNRTTIASWLGCQTMLYDGLSRCTLMYDPDGKLTTWLYDGFDRVTMQLNWNGTRSTWAYDARGRVAMIRHTTSGGALLELASYTYDEAGNPLTRTTNGGKTTTWTCDGAGQLQTEWHSLGTIDTFTWDPCGNRSQRARTQTGALTLATYAYDAAGQLVTMLEGTARTTFVYDLNGNMQSENTAPTGITNYNWDALNRLAAVVAPGGGRTTYAYRYDDLRASLNMGSGPQTFVWDTPGTTGFGDLFEELDATNARLRAYYRGPDLATQKDASGSYAFHWMDQGTAQILSDLNQVVTQSYQFSAWGEQFQSNGALNAPLSWNGQWSYYRDTTARTWVRARHLDVLRGRWLSQDPIGLAGGLNLYRYALNAPPIIIDPSGLDVYIITWGGGYGLGSHAAIGIDWPNYANPGKPSIYAFDFGPKWPRDEDPTTWEQGKYFYIDNKTRPGEVLQPTINFNPQLPIIASHNHAPPVAPEIADSVVQVKTTPLQDQLIRRWLLSTVTADKNNDPVPGKGSYGTYNGWERQCASFVRDALLAGGIKIPLRPMSELTATPNIPIVPNLLYYFPSPNMLRNWALSHGGKERGPSTVIKPSPPRRNHPQSH